MGALALLRSDARLFGLSAVLFLYHLAHAALPAVFVLFVGYRFDWGPKEVGLVLAAVGICSAIVQGGLVKPSIARFGARTTLLIGLVAGAIGFLAQGLAPTGFLYVIGIPIFTLWGLIGPSAQQMMTALVGPDQQGQLQGAGTSLMSVANMFGPIVFSQIFAWSIVVPVWGPALAGAPFLLAAVLLGAAAVMANRDALNDWATR